MPTLNYRVEATGINILKTVTDEVIFGLLEELDLTRSFKDSVYPMSSFMATSDSTNGHGVPNLVRNRCDVDANYVMDKSQVPWPIDTPYTTSAYGRRSNQKGSYNPIFVDPKAGILIEHQTVACAIELAFTLSFTTFDEASKAFDTIQSRYKGSLIGHPFHLAFSYPVSFDLMKYLVSVYDAKEDYGPPGNKTFIDYINDMKQTEISFDVRKSQITDPNADTELMVRVQQLNCLMQFNMDQKEPEPSMVDQLPDAFKISFNTIIQFGRPSIISVHTPVSVDNTLLPSELFSSIGYDPHYNHVISGVYSDLTCNEFMRRSYGNFNNAHQLVRMPVYDDWLKIDRLHEYFQYRPFFVAHFTLDGPTTTINLNELGDVQLHSVVKSIMKEMHPALLDYGGLFHIAVYADELKLGKELVTIDADLNLTITSNRKDKVYHLIISETTLLNKMNADWDHLLIKYRYFFPMTIERNLNELIKKKYFYIGYEDKFLKFLAQLSQRNRLKALLKKLVEKGEVTNEIYSYTQNVTQLADYLVYTMSLREDYVLPVGTDEASQRVREYYTTKASVESRSLFVALMEQCLLEGYITVEAISNQYLDPSRTVFPYYSGQGGYYGFNTPIRIFNYTFRT